MNILDKSVNFADEMKTALRHRTHHVPAPRERYSIMRAAVKDYKDLATLADTMLDAPMGIVLLCEGNWKVDRRNGQQ